MGGVRIFMDDTIDYVLLNDLIEYNKYRRYCFINNIEFEPDLNLERKLKARYMKVSFGSITTFN